MKLTKEKKAPHEQVCAVVTGQKIEGTTAGRSMSISKSSNYSLPTMPKAHREV